MASTINGPPDFTPGSVPGVDGQKVCPFMSRPWQPSGEYTLCLQENCQLWDAGASNCGANSSAVRQNLETNNEGSDQFTKVLTHIHDSHMHINASSTHTPDNLDAEMGNYILGVMPMKMPQSNTLVSEFMSGEDLDHDDLIYGIDFSIYGNDMPNMLKQIQQDPTFRQRLKSDAYRWTWPEYLAMKETGSPPSSSGDNIFDGGTYS